MTITEHAVQMSNPLPHLCAGAGALCDRLRALLLPPEDRMVNLAALYELMAEESREGEAIDWQLAEYMIRYREQEREELECRR